MKITILDRCTVTNGDVSLCPLESVGQVQYYDVLPQQALVDAIGDSDAVIVNKARITAEVMDGCPNLRFIGLFATGYNNIDTIAAAERGIVVCNVPGYSTNSVVLFTLSNVLALYSKLYEYNQFVKSGEYRDYALFMAIKTVNDNKPFYDWEDGLKFRKENALRRFKKQCARAGVIAEVRKREAYEKPSVKRKKKSEAARKRKFK